MGFVSNSFSFSNKTYGGCRGLEFLLTNGLGGYCSQTVLGSLSRKYHGLLISSVGDLEQRVILSSVLEEVVVGGERFSLSVNEYGDSVDDRGLSNLVDVCVGKNFVRFNYAVGGVSVSKLVQLGYGVNAVRVVYSFESDVDFEFFVRPLLNDRCIHDVGGDRKFSQSLDGDNIIITLSSGVLSIFSNGFTPHLDGVWHRGLFYFLERLRGEADTEDVYSPGFFSYRSGGGLSTVDLTFSLGFLGDFVWQKLCDYDLSPNLLLSEVCESFIVDVLGEKSVMAGYHWFRDWGRDTMISLPGLTMVNNRFDIASAVLARFIDHMHEGRIPTRFTPDGPIYYDFDGTLWMVDRLKEYVRHLGWEKSRDLILPRWSKLKSIVSFYEKNVVDGILQNRKGTWMDTLPRNNAVEVQALWYNALGILEDFSMLIGDGLDYSCLKNDFESSFWSKYFNGNYLNDCLGDSSFRPNQAIALSLEYSVVDGNAASDILRQIDERLLTSYGLRTLASDDPKYCGRYFGGVDERERAYHNGTVWPWLIGPYCRACVNVGGDTGRKYVSHIIGDVLDKIGGNCVGSLNEIYDGDYPHIPCGAISQAWSVAEVLRAYVEDTPTQKKL